MGQVIDAEGVKNDPAKVKAILDRKDPESVPDVRRILGMVNQLMKFVPNLAEKSKPERNLLRKGVSWTRGKDQQDAFNSLKMDLASPETLAVQNENCGFSGEVFLQRQENGKLQPDAYASRSLTETEQRYAQIEK